MAERGHDVGKPMSAKPIMPGENAEFCKGSIMLLACGGVLTMGMMPDKVCKIFLLPMC